jgi:uncharacterized protein (TIGR03084 family)
MTDVDTPTAASIAADLAAEQAALDEIVAPLDDDQWELATPSPRWAVRDQIGHLAFFDGTAALSITDPEGFVEHRAAFMQAVMSDRSGSDDVTLGETRAMTPAELLGHWRTNRSRLADAAATLDDADRVEWYGPSMGAKSFLTARLMEVFAHGQDIIDTVGGDRPVTDRIRHIAQLGVITRGWSYVNRGLEVPEGEIRVELVAPSGAIWTWGPDDAAATVVGPAVDFVLVTIQRRALADTVLEVSGELAADWMAKAQAFAGPPTDGPAHQP